MRLLLVSCFPFIDIRSFHQSFFIASVFTENSVQKGRCLACVACVRLQLVSLPRGEFKVQTLVRSGNCAHGPLPKISSRSKSFVLEVVLVLAQLALTLLVGSADSNLARYFSMTPIKPTKILHYAF